VDDVRWFASNAYSALLVPALRELGLSIATEGREPARLALAMSARCAEAAWRFAKASGSRLLVYVWDLQPWRTGTGSYDPVWWMAGRFVRLPRPLGGYPERRGHQSRLRYVAAHADAVWVPSAMSREIVSEQFDIACERVPYCYDSGRFEPALAAKEVPPTLLTVSRLQAYKDQAAVLRAAALLDGAVQVRIIGRGPERDRLEELARRLGVVCRIETSADDATVARAYHEARVVVCPSRFEGFGLTPVEGVASGVPVVASDIPPHREFVGGAARLVPPGDDLALAAAIAEALDAAPADPGLVCDLTIPAAAARFLASLQPLLG
jgi:glycosyltransferase involved in cell wall biosynthesis